MMRALTVLLALSCGVAFADQTASAPKDGARVASPVKVVFGLKGMGVAPAGIKFDNTGHHHLLVDTAVPSDLTQPLPVTDNIRHFGKGQTETTLDLPPGKHTLQLLFADATHTPFTPNVVSRRSPSP
jgi:hypothetical protein